MKHYIVIAENLHEARQHVNDAMKERGLKHINVRAPMNYRGYDWKLMYGQHPSQIMGLHDVELIKVGNWKDNPHLKEFEVVIKQQNNQNKKSVGKNLLDKAKRMFSKKKITGNKKVRK